MTDLLKVTKGSRGWMAGAIIKSDPEEPAPITLLMEAFDPGRAVATRKTVRRTLEKIKEQAGAWCCLRRRTLPFETVEP